MYGERKIEISRRLKDECPANECPEYIAGVGDVRRADVYLTFFFCESTIILFVWPNTLELVSDSIEEIEIYYGTLENNISSSASANLYVCVFGPCTLHMPTFFSNTPIKFPSMESSLHLCD